MPRVKRAAPDEVHDLDANLPDVTNKSSKSQPLEGPTKRFKKDSRGVQEVEEFQPLLEQLRYGKVIKKICEIRELTKEAMKKIGEEMILPRIIVIGNESSGKSSTLERIAGQAVLPCADGICTRAPVVLELKYDPGVVQALIFFKGFEGDYVQVSNAEEARTKVRAAMETLKSVGIAPDKEVRVKIVSQDVPTLDLVDLPGLVLARNNLGENKEPDNISELTVSCAKRYLNSSDTAVVLCIVDASEPNLRTVKALGLVQDCANYETLKEYMIGVFAQSDKTYDANFKDEDRPGPRWHLEQRLLGTAEDQVHVANGFVAVKNRNSRSQNAKNEDLRGCLSNEKKWFENESAFRENAKDNFEVTRKLSDRLGLCALLKKIDKVFCKHLNDHWVPREVAAIDKERVELASRLQQVNTAVNLLVSNQLLQHMRDRLAAVFTNARIEELSLICWNRDSFLNLPSLAEGAKDMLKTNAASPVLIVSERIRAWSAISDAVDQYAARILEHFTRKFMGLIEVEFDRDCDGSFGFVDLKDPTFRGWKLLLCRALASFVQELRKKMKAVFKDEMLRHKGAFIAGSMSAHQMVQAIMLEHIVLPCVECPNKEKLPWLSRCAKSIQQEGAKLFKAQLEEFEGKIQKCDQVKLILTHLLQSSTSLNPAQATSTLPTKSRTGGGGGVGTAHGPDCKSKQASSLNIQHHQNAASTTSIAAPNTTLVKKLDGHGVTPSSKFAINSCIVPVMVAGVVGKIADALNGVYEPTGEVYNSKPLFRKQNDSDKWLRFSTNNLWMFSPSANKDANDTEAFCHSVHTGKDLPTQVNTWQIYGNGAENKWEVHSPMKCIVAPGPVMVAGVVGPKADSLNGVYEPTGDLYNDKPLFKKRNDPGGTCEWLRFTTRTVWVFSETVSKDANSTNGWCSGMQTGKDNPTEVSAWQINGNKEQCRWEVHYPMKCIVAP